MTATLSEADRRKIAELLDRTDLCTGLGKGTRPDGRIDTCSIAAINLALTGRLTDTIPACMSRVIGRWITHIQDHMPAEVRNGREWRALLPLAAGTGREHEAQRRDLILAWMWGRLGDEAVLRAVPEAVRPAWDTMLDKKTAAAASSASSAAASSSVYAAAVYADAAASSSSVYAAAVASAVAVSYAASYAASHAAVADAYWARADVPGLLRALVEVSA